MTELPRPCLAPLVRVSKIEIPGILEQRAIRSAAHNMQLTLPFICRSWWDRFLHHRRCDWYFNVIHTAAGALPYHAMATCALVGPRAQGPTEVWKLSLSLVSLVLTLVENFVTGDHNQRLVPTGQ